VQGMGFMDKAKEMLNQHDDKVDQALEKGGDTAKERFAGHDEHVDQGVDHLQGMTGAGDTTEARPEEPTEEPTEEPPPPPQ
jgi:hypothetical protein